MMEILRSGRSCKCVTIEPAEGRVPPGDTAADLDVVTAAPLADRLNLCHRLVVAVYVTG
jgi:hypothetical protein